MPEPFLIAFAAIALAAIAATGWILAERKARSVMDDLQALLECVERGPHD